MSIFLYIHFYTYIQVYANSSEDESYVRGTGGHDLHAFFAEDSSGVLQVDTPVFKLFPNDGWHSGHIVKVCYPEDDDEDKRYCFCVCFVMCIVFVYVFVYVLIILLFSSSLSLSLSLSLSPSLSLSL